MMPWLTCVIPTIGRPTLARTLDSLDAQAEAAGVEVLVVADTFGGLGSDLREARAHVLEDRDAERYRWLEHDGGLHCFGQPQRTHGAAQARAPWVWFSQDDNVAAPGALAAIQRATRGQHHPRPLFFRWLAPWKAVIWMTPQLQLGNIDADCLVFPREIAEHTEWGLRYEGDFDAAVRAFNLAGGDVGWIDELVSIAHPSATDYWWERAA